MNGAMEMDFTQSASGETAAALAEYRRFMDSIMVHTDKEMNRLSKFLFESFPAEPNEGIVDMAIRLLAKYKAIIKVSVDPSCKKCGKKMIPGYGFDFDPTECNDCAPEVWKQYVEKLRSLPKEQTENLASHGRGLSWLIGTTYTELRAREGTDSQSVVFETTQATPSNDSAIDWQNVRRSQRVMIGGVEYDFVEFGEEPETNR